MADENQGSSDRHIAQQTQEKFVFYFLSLVFTLLALSAQTSKLGRSTVEDILELIGWAGLLTSGLVGLWRMEWEPVIRVKLGIRNEYQQARSDLKRHMLGGLQEVHLLHDNQSQPVEERLENLDNALSKLDSLIDTLEGHHSVKYTVAKYAFVLGLVFVIASRSAAAIADLLNYQLLNL